MQSTELNGTRYYPTPEGWYKSVTTIISEAKKLNSDNNYILSKWGNDLNERVNSAIQLYKLGFEKTLDPIVQECMETGKDLPELIKHNALRRGISLHKLIEDYFDTIQEFKIRSCTEDVDKLYSLMLPLLDTIHKEHVWIEEFVYHPWGYAGKTDLVAMYEGQFTVFDWKNSRRPKKREYLRDYMLQIAAYYKAFNHHHHEFQITQAVIAIAVYPDKYLAFTNPEVKVEPELQLFRMNVKQLDDWADKFKDLCLLVREVSTEVVEKLENYSSSEIPPLFTPSSPFPSVKVPF